MIPSLNFPSAPPAHDTTLQAPDGSEAEAAATFDSLVEDSAAPKPAPARHSRPARADKTQDPAPDPAAAATTPQIVPQPPVLTPPVAQPPVLAPPVAADASPAPIAAAVDAPAPGSGDAPANPAAPDIAGAILIDQWGATLPQAATPDQAILALAQSLVAEQAAPRPTPPPPAKPAVALPAALESPTSGPAAPLPLQSGADIPPDPPLLLTESGATLAPSPAVRPLRSGGEPGATATSLLWRASQSVPAALPQTSPMTAVSAPDPGDPSDPPLPDALPAEIPPAGPDLLPDTAPPAAALLFSPAAAARVPDPAAPLGPPSHTPFHQIVAAVHAHLTLPDPGPSQPGATELTLNPIELGRIRFDVTGQGDQMRIQVTAERSDTALLLQRHVQDLRAELHSAGLGQTDLSFAGWGQGGSAHAPQIPPAFADAETEDPTPTPQFPRPPQPSLGATGIDLRY